jgi:hypothetical protein
MLPSSSFSETLPTTTDGQRSAESETLATSVSGYAEKAACEQDVRRLKADKYPDAEVLDVSIRGRAQQ